MTTPTTTARLDRGVLTLAAVLIVGAMAPLLDSTIVTVAIHTLGVELHTSVSTVQWVSTAYLLALAMAVPITGWSANRFGAKRMWIIAFRDLEPAQMPHASSTTRIMQQLGGAFGAATLAVVVQSQLIGHPASTAFAHSFGWAIAFTVIAAVPALLLPRRRALE
jgi:MFS family permease